MLNMIHLLILIFVSFLNTTDSLAADSPNRIAKTDGKMVIREHKSCQEYLSICERSCKERGTVFKFQCIGQDFQPYNEHTFCQCADDLFRQVSQSQKLQIKKESAR
ncbi:MAG: hypothetical protein JZU65_10740 [Chlorobium sp.]|nr:hypothetical protein [Chlorobium sp.]